MELRSQLKVVPPMKTATGCRAYVAILRPSHLNLSQMNLADDVCIFSWYPLLYRPVMLATASLPRCGIGHDFHCSSESCLLRATHALKSLAVGHERYDS